MYGDQLSRGCRMPQKGGCCATASVAVSGLQRRMPKTGISPEQRPAKYEYSNRYPYCDSGRLHHSRPGTKWRLDIYAYLLTQAVQQLVLVEAFVLWMLRPELRYVVPAAPVVGEIEGRLSAVGARHGQNAGSFDSC